MTDRPLTLTAIRLLQSDNECPDTVYIPDTVYQAIPYPDNHTVPRHFEVAAYCKKTANYFLYFTDDTYKSVLFTTACSFLFHQSNRLDKGGVRGCAKRRAAIDSAQDWTDQAKHLSSESFLLCIPLDALLTAVYSCLLTTKNGERTAPTTVRPLSIHQTNSMSAKKQVLL